MTISPGLAKAARTLTDAVYALIEAIPNLNAYRGEVPVTPPADPDGKIHAYAVLYSGSGRAYATRACNTTSDLSWSFQVTCVGGDDTRCLWAAGKVRAALTGVELTAADVKTATLEELLEETRIQVDRAVSPPRFYVPLVYGLPASG